MFNKLINLILSHEKTVETNQTLDTHVPVEDSFFPSDENMPQLSAESFADTAGDEDGLDISELTDSSSIYEPPAMPEREAVKRAKNLPEEEKESDKEHYSPEKAAAIYERLFKALIHYLNRQFDNKFSGVISAYEKSFRENKIDDLKPQQLIEEKMAILKDLIGFFKKEAVSLIEKDLDFITARMLDSEVINYIDKASNSYSEDFILMVLIEAFFEKKHITTIEDFPGLSNINNDETAEFQD